MPRLPGKRTGQSKSHWILMQGIFALCVAIGGSILSLYHPEFFGGRHVFAYGLAFVGIAEIGLYLAYIFPNSRYPRPSAPDPMVCSVRQARAYLNEAMATGRRSDIEFAYMILASVHDRRREFDRAAECYLELFRQGFDRQKYLRALARVYHRAGQAERADIVDELLSKPHSWWRENGHRLRQSI